MPELDDATYAQVANIDAFVRRGLANPKTRRKLLEVQKELNPDVAIPELDESDPIREEFKSLRSEMQKERDERSERDRLNGLMGQWNAGKAFARKKGYSDEGIAKLEEFMQQHALPSHEAAIPYFEQVNPPPQPAVGSGTRWDFFGPQNDDSLDMKALYEGRDEEFLQKTISDTLNKVRSGEISR